MDSEVLAIAASGEASLHDHPAFPNDNDDNDHASTISDDKVADVMSMYPSSTPTTRVKLARRFTELPRRAADFSTLLADTSIAEDKKAADTNSINIVDTLGLKHVPTDVHRRPAETPAAPPRTPLLAAMPSEPLPKFFDTPEEPLEKSALRLFGSSSFSETPGGGFATGASADAPMTGAEISALSASLFSMFQRTPEYTRLMKGMDEWLGAQKKKAMVSKAPDSAGWQEDFSKEVKSFVGSVVDHCRGYLPYSHPPTQPELAELAVLASSKSTSLRAKSEARASIRRRDSAEPDNARVRSGNRSGQRLPGYLLAERHRHLGLVAALAVNAPRPGTSAYYSHTVAVLMGSSNLDTPFPRPPRDRIVQAVVERGKLMVSGDHNLVHDELVRMHEAGCGEELMHSEPTSASALFAAHASIIDSASILERSKAAGGVAAPDKHNLRHASTSLQSVPTLLGAAQSALRRAEIAGELDSSPASATDNLARTTRPSSPVVSDSMTGGRPRSRTTTAPPLQIPPEALEYVRNQMERHAMIQLYPFTFATALEDRIEDARIFDRLMELQWLSPQELRVPDGACKPLVLRMAVQELRQMNQKVSPEDKLNCIVSACTVLYKALTMSVRRQAGEFAAAGADEFLPALIYVTLQANVRRLISNLNYIQRFRDDAQMMGRPGYCFVNLQSAVYYLTEFDPRPLDIPLDKYAARCTACRQGLMKPWLESASVKQ